MSHQKTVIIGAGQTGLSCLRFLKSKEKAHTVQIIDTRLSPPKLADCYRIDPHLDVILGELPEAALYAATRVIVSPGIRLDDAIGARCQAKQIPIISDVALFSEYAKAPVIGITGSNGKGTVTMLVKEMAKCAGKQAVACGNIGYPVLDALCDLPVPDWYIAELSSFQLASTPSLKTHAAVILNISADHLDYHGTLAHYKKSKQRIYTHCAQPIVNRDAMDCYQGCVFATPPLSYGLNPAPTDQDVGLIQYNNQMYFAQGQHPVMPVADLKIVGQHNWYNALAAIAIAQSMSLPIEAVKTALRRFAGLAHRCQWVGQKNGVNWYNDSKGTNVGASMAAIQAVALQHSQGALLLLMGGQAKGADFTTLIPAIKQSVKQIYAFGQDADLIKSALSDATTVTVVPDLKTAVIQANQIASSGDSVLMSPACASYDMFKGFADRGEYFTACVKELIV